MEAAIPAWAPMTTLRPAKGREQSAHCTHCSLRRVCDFQRAGLVRSRTQGIPVHRRRLARGDTLYRSGEPVTAIYAVRTGCVKDVMSDGDGTDVVVAFLLPGDAAGLSALGTGCSASRAVALEETLCCELSWSSIRHAAEGQPEVHWELTRMLAQTSVSAQALFVSLTRRTARARVAGFLLQLFRRLHERGAEGSEFRLSMSRRDIGAYLGLALETVSRCLAQLAGTGLIRVRARQVVLLQPDELARIAAERNHGD